MMPLDQSALEEIENLAAEGDLDPDTRIAHAAELRALRKLHHVAQQKRWALTRELDRLPGVADVAAWKRLVARARDVSKALDTAAAVDLVSSTRKG